MNLQVSKPAPQFTLPAYVKGSNESKNVSLSDYKGKWVVLFFYPLDFTFVCPTEIREFSKHEDEFKKLNAQILSCSIDSFFSHKTWYEKDLQEVKFPALSDITKSVSNDYGVLIVDKGIALRGTFIIDPEGILKYQVVSDLGIGRSVQETLRVLKALQTGALCPADWKPGDKTL